MRLKKDQKEAVLKLIAAGLRTDEINDKAAQASPPYSVSRRQVAYYRKVSKSDLSAMIKAGKEDAITEGLALRGERVRRLKQLAVLMEKDLFGGFLWTEQVKGVGSGPLAEIVDYEEFNKAEVDAYRGVLDDIAKEVGGRIKKSELTGAGGADLIPKPTQAEIDERVRAIVAEVGSE